MSERVGELLHAAGIPDALAGRQRVASLSAPERALYGWLLRRFADGHPPSVGELNAHARSLGIGSAAQALDRIEGHDLIGRDARSGEIVTAYPFSATPTEHRVHLGGVTVYAMCAIDALGIAAMLGRDTHVQSRDPLDGQPIDIQVTASGTARWTPPDAVALAASHRDGCGSAASICCQVTNFFASPDTAARYLAEHPAVNGTTASIPDALATGTAIFGHTLDNDQP